MEFILIFRKGGLRSFAPKDPDRYKRKFTKKERDQWFSQVWSITGARQNIEGLDRRIAAFPEEIPRRLIRMFSIVGDLVWIRSWGQERASRPQWIWGESSSATNVLIVWSL